MLGRVIDPLGEPLDGKGLIGGELCEMPLERKAPGVIYRQPVNQPLPYIPQSALIQHILLL